MATVAPPALVGFMAWHSACRGGMQLAAVLGRVVAATVSSSKYAGPSTSFDMTPGLLMEPWLKTDRDLGLVVPLVPALKSSSQQEGQRPRGKETANAGCTFFKGCRFALDSHHVD
ncbi:hypothetical protein IWX90DRAFT_411982 [Phyllosticta citrichinensis]|uniref:Secreted protein n=1 Tax=Phyllosticta citrichinensis TaxID=1130410 RepID=A0ABR1Y2L9_9PEZI